MEYCIVDAFTDEVFRGNPAGVCILKNKISNELMQKIAKENNLPETAFLCKRGERYTLKWFTPQFEIDLCGHATLASAYVIFRFLEPQLKEVEFETVSGILKVVKKGQLYEMTFPGRMPEKIEVTKEIKELLGTEPTEVYSERDLYIVMRSEQEVKDFIPNYDKMLKLQQWLGIVITAPGINADFVSRYFCPELRAEDPVTGSSHSSLVPLWSQKTGKMQFRAEQLSERGGILYCENESDTVKIAGKAVLYMKGSMIENESL